MQQSLGIRGRQPAAIFRDADRHHFIFIWIDRFENRSRREQRNFVLAAASAKKNAHPQFFHYEFSVDANSDSRQGTRLRQLTDYGCCAILPFASGIPDSLKNQFSDCVPPDYRFPSLIFKLVQDIVISLIVNFAVE